MAPGSKTRRIQKISSGCFAVLKTHHMGQNRAAVRRRNRRAASTDPVRFSGIGRNAYATWALISPRAVAPPFSRQKLEHPGREDFVAREHEIIPGKNRPHKEARPSALLLSRQERLRSISIAPCVS